MLVTSIFSFSHDVLKSFLLGLCSTWLIKTANNPFPHDKTLDKTKLIACADDKCNKNDSFVFDRVEIIVGKPDNKIFN